MITRVRQNNKRLLIRKRFEMNKGDDVASASTVTLPENGNRFDVTGTTAIKYITTTDWDAGAIVVLQFDGAVVVHNDEGSIPDNTGEILLAGAQDWTTAAGDRLILEYDGTAWVELARMQVGAQTQQARFQLGKGADVASATTITLGNDGNYFDITGTTQIDYITKTNWQAGSVLTLQFDGSVTVSHNEGSPGATAANILLSGAANLSATADDTLTLVFDGTNFREIARTVI